MKEYYWYNTYTGYSYSITEHAKLRIWERFKTMDIDREFYLYHRLLTNPVIDDIVIDANIVIRNLRIRVILDVPTIVSRPNVSSSSV